MVLNQSFELSNKVNKNFLPPTTRLLLIAVQKYRRKGQMVSFAVRRKRPTKYTRTRNIVSICGGTYIAYTWNYVEERVSNVSNSPKSKSSYILSGFSSIILITTEIIYGTNILEHFYKSEKIRYPQNNYTQYFCSLIVVKNWCTPPRLSQNRNCAWSMVNIARYACYLVNDMQWKNITYGR